MIWLTWRQFRVQAAAACALLAVVAATLLIAGPPLTGSQARLAEAANVVYLGGIVAVYVLPAVIGAFWGAPLVARELEAGTVRLVWNQSVTRSRWLDAKMGLTGLAAVLTTAVLTMAVTLWSDPIDAATRPNTIHAVSDEGSAPEVFAARITPWLFGARGIVPIGHALFAFVLGVAIGILLRRTVPAMAVTLAVFAVVQIATPALVRPYLIPAVRETVTITGSSIDRLGPDDDGVLELGVAGPRGAWILDNRTTVDAAGKEVTAPDWVMDCVPVPTTKPTPQAEVTTAQCFARLSDLGYRQRLTYQPADRFWTLQWRETGLFLLLSALLSALCFRWTKRRLP
ncbi:ABC transporter permease [Nonomuraea sp. NBC_01738]|uniref:ABC transporter permease n=1 Tax=Nonomuraea sp. NBC_01738 TaxID=2976003 RepID=UPI002E0DD46B|nr:ABC transporter permease [Nonomuraea sp. NBC_01738]